ncbi:hypothetical protein [Leptospira mayottensis]|uniref:Uncharacterized protein n=2 Tax=Leptospira mayottensis TaxID=1137606 RepID=A0AA87SUN3_9LEPT|nr:hypothetical protein [Leptospira mayottensis]AXR66567.1 hypothetical protein DQM28_20390 [Leptospira mayottensis]AXR66639.1 hypothetical protein DQM28_20840 [Leptospira mayottensis]AZQ04203.1 hypothetical protein LEP1GSC190_19305 [Leptospira mayottensis 200901116]EKR98093.1 hypothetical protein LEP1GSC125_1556 [Leptospira mayottensis 200901122]TGN04318.1 hypothetical protein EHR03_10775 [Leptospira mayottensis]
MPAFLGPFSSDEILTESQEKSLKISQVVELDFSSPLGSYNLGEILPIGTIVNKLIVKVDKAFNELPILTIGNTISPDIWLDTSSLDFSMEGIYLVECYDRVNTATQAKVYWNPKDTIKGRLKAYLITSF